MIKIIFYVLLLLFNLLIYKSILDIQKQEKCECKNGWKIENIKIISLIIILLSLINLFIPINKFLYNIPVIGTFITFALVILVFGQIFILIRFSREIKSGRCMANCKSNWLFDNIKEISLTTTFIISIILSVILLYL